MAAFPLPALGVFIVDVVPMGFQLGDLLVGGIVIAGYGLGALSWRYYPSVKGAGFAPLSVLCYLSFLILNLIPVILEQKEAAVCRRLQSQI